MKKVFIFSILSAILGGCNSKPNIKLPTYTEIEHKVYSIPIKRQISVRVYLNDQASKEQLEALTDSLYLAAKYEKTQHGDPTHVFIYVYAKHGDYEQNSGGWIATRQKIQSDETQTTIRK